MNRALAVLILTMGMAPVTAEEPAEQSASRSVVLPRGVTEEQLLRLLFSDYDERIRKSKAGESGDLNWDVFSVRVDAVIETDFGWCGDRFLVATASGMAGQCAQCQIGRAVVLDFDATKMLFQFPVDPEFSSVSGEPRLFPIGEKERTLSVALQMFRASQGGWYFEDELWFHPERRADGNIGFVKVWEGRVGAGTGGNRGASAYKACGAMVRIAGSWHHVLSTYYGDDLEVEDDEGLEEDGSADPFSDGWGIVCEDGKMGEVEIRHVQRFSQALGSPMLNGDKPVSKRIDHETSGLFPFNLPEREGAWTKRDPRGSEPRFMDENAEAASPSRSLVAKATPRSGADQDRLVIRRSKGGAVIRTINLHHGDAFYGQVLAVGWSGDESRTFIVIKFGNGHKALLSFSVEGKDDYWEGLIESDDTSWANGFVMQSTAGAKGAS